MAISKFNSEGYYDPTTYEALSKVEREEKAARYRPLVYICSPFSGDISENTPLSKKLEKAQIRNSGKCVLIRIFIAFAKVIENGKKYFRE